MLTVIYQAPFSQSYMGFDPSYDYRIVWEEENNGRTPEDIWLRFQRVDIDHMPPDGYKGRSLSVGDVISIGDDFYTPEPVGWKKLSEDEKVKVYNGAKFYSIVTPGTSPDEGSFKV
jgi:YodL-like